MPIHIDCYGESHVGQRRSTNEDQFLIADLNKSMQVHQSSLGLSQQTRLFGGSQGKLLLVADGLGGHESGERASTLAVDGVAHYVLNTMDWFFRLNDHNEDEFESELKAAFHHSQSILTAESEAIPQRRGMATTLTMAYVDWPKLYVVHVGDTRCYLVRDNTIKCLTTDHTIGQLAEAMTAHSGRTSDNTRDAEDTVPLDFNNEALWNVIGGHDQALSPQVLKSELSTGDSILLCSDGLTRYVPDQELLELINQDSPASETCRQFVEMSNQRGGIDNITAVLANFTALKNAESDNETEIGTVNAEET